MKNVLQIGMKPVAGLLLIAILIWLFIGLQPVLMPFLLGALFGYLGDPVAYKLEEWRVGRTAAVSLRFI